MLLGLVGDVRCVPVVSSEEKSNNRKYNIVIRSHKMGANFIDRQCITLKILMTVKLATWSTFVSFFSTAPRPPSVSLFSLTLIYPFTHLLISITIIYISHSVMSSGLDIV
jgi:hypothetical protein